MVMRVVRAKNTEIRAVWCNSELILPDAAAALGMSKDTLQARAAALGLPQRRTGRREAIRPHQEKEFRLMWRAGVSARLIGLHFGCSYFAVVNTANRLQLEPRGAGFRPRISLDAYREARLGISMKVRVASEAEAKRIKIDALRANDSEASDR